MKTRVLSMLTLLIICMGVNAQNVNIPDASFKSYLVNNHTINTNQDTEIQESEAIAFAGSMFCDNRSISDLTGIEAFPNIVELFCHDNDLTTINVSNNTALRYLDVSDNALSSIDASAIVGLRQFDVSGNPMSSIDVSSNTALNSLYCYNNNLTTLDLSNNTALIELSCGDNALTTLDVTANSTLYDIYCQNNALTSLKVANGVNSPYGRLNALNNPNLTCIEVDDVAWSTANWTNIDATASFSTSCVATPCTVNIPDANFKAYLVGNSVINTNGDTEIQCSEATAFTGLINCSSLSISDLTGIEAFINITDLICRDNNLTSIDISAIPNLGGLDCSDNQLTSLDTSLNTGLYNLRCANNALTSIDLSTHPYINTLYCNGNNITTLNLSNLTTLYDLNCSDNQITSIDASNIPLQYFECQNNALTSLNVANGNNYNIVDFEATNNPNLPCIQVDDVAYSTTNWTNIDAASSFSTSCAACVVNIPNANLKQILVSVADTNGNNEVECTAAIAYTGTLSIGYLGLTNLIGVEAFINVTNISCPSNNITSYDFSANTQLTYLYINDNNFTSLDVSSLTNLETLYVSFNNLTGLDVSNLSNLEDLAIYNNQITSLDVSTNTSLESLHCGLNSLTSLNVANGNNTNFTSFNAESNPNLTCIQVDNVAYSTTNWTDIDPTASYSTNCSACTVNIPDANFKTYLVGNAAINTDGDTEISCSEAMAFNGTIDCSNLSIADLTGIEAFTSLAKLYSHTNQLTSLDVSDITTLNYLTCYGNQLTSLDLSNNTALTYLNYSENQITSLDLSNNTALEYLFCNDNQITSLDLSNNTALVKLSCTTNQLTSLDVSVNTALEDLNCSVNQLISLDLSNNTALTKMYCVDNQITDLDLSALTVLESLFCNENELTSLNIANTNNANMLHMFANDNPNLSCIQVDDVAYSAANWTNIDPIVNFSTNCRGLSVGDFMKNTVSIYPNPTTSVLNIKMDSNLKRATIYSTLGAIVLETTSKTIATANLKSGFYLIRIEDENGNIATNRFIKE